MIIAWTNEVDDRSAPVGEPESDAEMFVIINFSHEHESNKITDHIQEPGHQIETWEIFFNIKTKKCQATTDCDDVFVSSSFYHLLVVAPVYTNILKRFQ